MSHVRVGHLLDAVMRAGNFVVFLMSISAAGCSHTLERRYDDFHNYIQNSERDRKFQTALAEKYESSFGIRTRVLAKKGCSPGDSVLFRAAFEASFFGLEEYAEHMSKLLRRMEGCGESTDQQYDEMFKVYVKMRAFDAARDIQRLRPLRSMETLPATVDTLQGAGSVGGMTEWVIDEREPIMRRVAVDDLGERKIVVLSHPQCHFSENAMKSIESDPRLFDLFREHGKWVAPPLIDVSFDVLQNWNKAHPAFRHTLAHSGREWTIFGKIGTPTFYFLRAGKVVDVVEGWPREGRREEILRAADRAGMN